MPVKVCAEPGCPHLTDTTRCTTHARTYDRQTHDRKRKQIYSSRRWRTLRSRLLRQHPYCQAPDCTSPATDVDHITPLQNVSDPYDVTNLQCLCRRHHSQKTQREVHERK